MPSRVRDSIPERVAPTLRDGTESEISHTFPVPAMCRRYSRVDREPDVSAETRTLGQCPLGCVIHFQNALSPRYATEANRRFLTRSPFPGPSLDETLRMLKPLAPTLEVLVLSGNKLGGTITDDIAAFTKLTIFFLDSMNLKGTFVDTRARSARHTHERKRENPGSEEPGNEEREQMFLKSEKLWPPS